MTSLIARRRGISLTLAGALIAVLVLMVQPPAHADVTGGCEGSVDFSADDVGLYTPANDTKSNPVIVPKDDGNVANWRGSVPGANTDFSGKVEIRLGPAWIEVADWGFPDHDGTNAEDTRIDDGIYNMDELWDTIPKNIAQGIYEARAVHTAELVECEAQFFVKFEGNALSSPIVIVALLLALVFLTLVIVAGRRRATAGYFAGRPVLAAVSAFFLALMIALLLQQFCAWPLDNLTVVILPILLIAIGLVIAKLAPFGGVSPGVAEMAVRRARRDASLVDSPDDAMPAATDGAADSSEAGFEPGGESEPQ